MTLSMDRRQVIKFRFSFFVSRFNTKSDKFALQVFDKRIPFISLSQTAEPVNRDLMFPRQNFPSFPDL